MLKMFDKLVWLLEHLKIKQVTHLYTKPLKILNGKTNYKNLIWFLGFLLMVIPSKKNSPVIGWSGLSKQPNVKRKTHPSTNPQNHTATHRWGSLHRFQIFKQNWNILIHSSVIMFQLIWGGSTPWGLVDGWMECGCIGVPHASTHVHACTHICTCMLNMINMDASMEAAICN